jgi:uncharacterized membrane protein YciS (DUF1049 family)
MYAATPAQNTYTIYAQVGDAFAWLCIAAFILLVGWIIFGKYFTAKDLNMKDVHKKIKSQLAGKVLK